MVKLVSEMKGVHCTVYIIIWWIPSDDRDIFQGLDSLFHDKQWQIWGILSESVRDLP